VDLVSERLTEAHDLERFSSRVPDLDDWLRRSARHADAMNTGRTFVWHAGDAVIVAYFTLAAQLVARAQVPKRIGRGSPEGAGGLGSPAARGRRMIP
jgi:hypothetical protein